MNLDKHTINYSSDYKNIMYYDGYKLRTFPISDGEGVLISYDSGNINVQSVSHLKGATVMDELDLKEYKVCNLQFYDRNGDLIIYSLGVGVTDIINTDPILLKILSYNVTTNVLLIKYENERLMLYSSEQVT